MSTGRRGARWIAALLGVALVGSAIVAYLLIRVTAPTTNADQDLTAVTSGLPDPSAGHSSDPAPPTPSPAGSASALSGGAGSTGTAAPPTPVTSAPGLTSPSGSGPDRTDAGSASPATTAPPSTLPGSDVVLPAAWSGTAQVEITVTGACPGGTPQRYTTPADIALDVAGGGASATRAPATSSGPADVQPTLTIGVNASAVPTVAVYSSSVDNSGVFHRFWDLALAGSGGRTTISGAVVDDGVLSGNNPNLLVDAMSPPAGCATAPVTGLPRVLAAGSTLSGWVDADSAQVTLTAVTTDGQRALTVTITATRKR
jgi:hypothetical protein